MGKFRNIFSIMLAATVFCACGEDPELDMYGMMDGHSPDVNIRFVGVAPAGGSRAVISPSDAYKVYLGADMHIDSKASTAHTDSFLSKFADDDNAPMALILGDIVNGKYSMHSASERIRVMAGDKADAVFAAIGNHDLYFGLWEQWEAEWGDATYTIEVRTPSHTDLYVCVESGSGYLGSEQMEWLKETLETAAAKDYRHRIVFTHTHMFKKDMSQGHTSNYPIEETYELTGLFRRTGVEMFLSAHSHSRGRTIFNGVEYIVLDALEEHYPDTVTGYSILSAGEDLKCDFFSCAD